ncbi:hypothetical protein F4814DRAFT_429934 [Daldinia grandis]|nr:hypothetical protein F4814DRAFT_429934 [Daldinia grandis]
MSSKKKDIGMSGGLSTSSNNSNEELDTIASISATLSDIQARMRRYERRGRRVRFFDGDGMEAIEVLVKYITATQKCLEAHCEQLENIRSYVQDKNLDIVRDHMGAVCKHINAMKEQMDESVRVASLLQVRLGLLQNDHAQPVQANEGNAKDALPSTEEAQGEEEPREEPRRTIDHKIYTVRILFIVAFLALAYLGYHDVIFDEER